MALVLLPYNQVPCTRGLAGQIHQGMRRFQPGDYNAGVSLQPWPSQAWRSMAKDQDGGTRPCQYHAPSTRAAQGAFDDDDQRGGAATLRAAAAWPALCEECSEEQRETDFLCEMPASCFWLHIHGLGPPPPPLLLSPPPLQPFLWPLCIQVLPKHAASICCCSLPCSGNLWRLFWWRAGLHSVNHVSRVRPGGAPSPIQRPGSSWQRQSRPGLIQDEVWHPPNPHPTQVCLHIMN